MSLLISGCVQPVSSARSKSGGTGRQMEESLDTITDAFRKASDPESFRVAIQQLNSYLARHPNEKPRRLREDEQTVLSSRYGLDANQLAEVGSDTFTSLDAHYLDLCFLLRDAARSLQVDKRPPLDQAAAAFAWAIRQVRLREHPGGLLPAEFVLRWGWGTAPERAAVFLAVLRQLGIDGCMVAVPSRKEEPVGSASDAVSWAAGALIGKDIYLFDTRLGLPLPGPEGKGIATLAQVRSRPDLLRRLTVDAKYPYDISPEQARQAEVYVAVPLSALPPRMQALQRVLETGDRVKLWADPVGLLQRFEDATKGPAFAGSTVRVWSQSLNALRAFLPPEEGGADPTRQQRDQWVRQLVPGQYMPAVVRQLPGEPGQRLKQLFSMSFIYFSLHPRMPRELLLSWLPGLAQGKANNQGERQVSEVVLRERMPRDLVLRGRYDEATTLLVALRDELGRQREQARELVNDPAAVKQVQQWCDQIVQAYGTLLRAQEETRRGKGLDAAAGGDKAQKQVEELWKDSGAIAALVRGAAAGPMLGEVTYELALCKQEQAERVGNSRSARPEEKLTGQKAWKAAAHWWHAYLQDQPESAAIPSARRGWAQSLAAVGQREQAVALLKDLSGPMTPLEKTAHLYLARQLETR